MSVAKQIGLEADYDLVGKYQQDDINGFEQSIIEELFGLGEVHSAQRVLDAMAGDGNLSEALVRFCKAHDYALPQLSMLEYSNVQCDVARARPELSSTQIIWGDILKLCSRATNKPVEKSQYDRVFIKSASHEIPKHEQLTMYSNVFDLLEEGGLFVNLGFLFESSDERDEFREIARSKDTLAGLQSMAENRHFLTRDEFYALLRKAGFESPLKARPLTYLIKSWIVAEHYFAKSERRSLELQFQAAQAMAWHLRKSGKIVFHGERTSMYLPGEITVIQKNKSKRATDNIYDSYPYEFLENIKVHQELTQKVARLISKKGMVLDLGCGPGILYSKLQGKVAKYVGVDSSAQFLKRCALKSESDPRASFIEANINGFEPTPRSYDEVVLTNVLYQEGVDAIAVLKRAIGALVVGGQLIVSGPTAPSSFLDVAPKIEQDLLEDGYLPKYQALFEEICRSNEKLLVQGGNYWSVEGMVDLLMQLGATRIEVADNSIFYNHAYLVAARF
ncbi:MAG: class I SAM-dependent methyltransferase [Bdellovibrionales bacterium]|nr:class I SAM-dependent methyltransferase [Bdellovibrionales bacterium]